MSLLQKLDVSPLLTHSENKRCAGRALRTGQEAMEPSPIVSSSAGSSVVARNNDRRKPARYGRAGFVTAYFVTICAFPRLLVTLIAYLECDFERPAFCMRLQK